MRGARLFACGVALSVLAASAVAEIDILSVSFTCEGGTQIPVSYFNATDGTSAAAMVVDGVLVSMRQAPSGSGIRYESVDAVGTYVLRSKGWDATITHQATGSTAPERILYRNCSSR